MLKVLFWAITAQEFQPSRASGTMAYPIRVYCKADVWVKKILKRVFRFGYRVRLKPLQGTFRYIIQKKQINNNRNKSLTFCHVIEESCQILYYERNKVLIQIHEVFQINPIIPGNWSASCFHRLSVGMINNWIWFD